MLKVERNDEDYDKEKLLKEYSLKKLTDTTVCNWMRQLGFKYEIRKKCYYVDNHDSPENLEYRKLFIQRYLKYELRAHRWYSITKEKKEEMVRDGKLDVESGFSYERDGVEMIELHVDDHEEFQVACRSVPFGGNVSVRKPVGQRKLMMFGQDEVIFRQFLMWMYSWTLPDGTKQLVPKDDGMGLMLSSFCSRELGYGFPLTQDMLDLVNEQRKGQKYSDTNAAEIKFGTTFKPELKTSPFVREFEYGQNHDGYWTYDSMVLQFEDCIDVLKCLYPDFDFLFLFDHSNGHDRLQPNGLNLNKIQVRHGGKQPKMRDSVLTHDLLGPFPSIYKPGDNQSMQYTDPDPGPCYFDTTMRIGHAYDRPTGKLRTKKIIKLKLIEQLKQAGISDPTGTTKKLQEQCDKLGLPTTITEPVIVEGWKGKTKGSLQILYERGWINTDCIQLYTDKGRKTDVIVDNNGFIDPTGCNFSLKKLMKLQHDFTKEITLLQFHGKQMGVTVDRTPKCHPEIAGEGIEYAWGIAKLIYRRAPIACKKTKEKFIKLVRECTDSTTSLSVNRIRSCSKKARSYMLMYTTIQSLSMTNNVTVDTHSIMESTVKLYLKLKKKGKTHRGVLQQCKGDVLDIEKAVPIESDVVLRERSIAKVELINKLVKGMISM